MTINGNDPILFSMEKPLELLKNRKRSLMLSETSRPVYGIDFIEVTLHPKGGWNLSIYFFRSQYLASESKEKPSTLPPGITKDKIRISRIGTSGKVLQVQSVTYPDMETQSHYLKVYITESSTQPPALEPANRILENTSLRYYFELVHLAEVDTFFSKAIFFLGNNSPVDPRQASMETPNPQPVTPIDYLAKDYSGFRRLILDQMSLLVPQWKERHIPDLGIAIVEILAYAGDYLSYFQDAASTETYLNTARRRISVHRHARLLDYPMHDGCNTRLPIQVQVDYPVNLEKGTPLLSKIPGQQLRIPPEIYRADILIRNFQVRVFETMHPVALHPDLNEMVLYNWGIPGFTLEKGTVKAALEGHLPGLKAGDFLLFEVKYYDQLNHHLVRLNSSPVLTSDLPLKRPVTIISWPDEDALPTQWTLSETPESNSNVRVLGNIVLADFGRTIPGEVLSPVPENRPFYPRLNYTGVIYAVPYHDWWMKIPSGASVMNQNPQEAIPAVKLVETTPQPADFREKTWNPQRDLLKSGQFSREFVVESETDGKIYLRFGDGILGKKPAPGTIFKASYRVGNGHSGHCEPGTITHIVSDNGRITGIYSPVSSSNPVLPETLHKVRIDAPQTFKTQERCITPGDYAAKANEFPTVKDVRVNIRWTGSWQTAYIYVDRTGNKPVNHDFITHFHTYLSPFRPSGIDLEIRGPYFVELVITLNIYIIEGAFPGPVRQKLTDCFSSGIKADGTNGFFHPDNFTFGQTLYLSTLVARAMQIPGVARVEVEEFRRYDTPAEEHTIPSHIPVKPLEILRLDNSANAPGNGVITFNIMSNRRNPEK